MSEENKLPRVAITMGDPAGIGPEIVLKALEDASLKDVCHPVIVGDLGHLRRTGGLLGINLKTEVIDLENVQDDVEFGEETGSSGRASAEYIKKAVELWSAGEIDAASTAPISKNAIKMGGYDYPGHTEFLAELTGTEKFAMSFFAEKLRVVLLSTHVSLRDAIARVKADRLVDLIRFSQGEIEKLIGRKVRVAVAGLNPHASEGGMFGGEEAAEMIPAIERCRIEGIDVSGPYSPDTIFLRGFKGEFDLVVACYHDQATIAVKSLSFGTSVNVTLGLPLIRTSVDHGTAFDIAGKGVAEHSSMTAAIKLAAELVTRRHSFSEQDF